MRIGVDVGGTNTDAVLVDGRDVLAEAKTATTPDVTSGIEAAIGALVESSTDEVSRVQAVMIGTTHFTNAVVEARRLAPTGVIRLGLPATEALPPLVAWPTSLREALSADVRLCHGGHEFDGRRISPVDTDELKRAAADFAAKGIRTIAISSVFSPVNAEAERRGRGRDRRRAARRRALAVARDRTNRPPRARERDDHERLSARARVEHRRRPRHRPRAARDRRPRLSEPERRHADDASNTRSAIRWRRSRRGRPTRCAAPPSSPGSPTAR